MYSVADSPSSSSDQLAAPTAEDGTLTQMADEQTFGLKLLIPGEDPLVE